MEDNASLVHKTYRKLFFRVDETQRLQITKMRLRQIKYEGMIILRSVGINLGDCARRLTNVERCEAMILDINSVVIIIIKLHVAKNI